MNKTLFAQIWDGKHECRFPIEDPSYEDKISELLHELCGDTLHPLNHVPYFMEGSSWCYNGRCKGDAYEAIDENENTLFEIEIIEA